MQSSPRLRFQKFGWTDQCSNLHTHGFDALQMHKTTPHHTTHVHRLGVANRCHTFPGGIMPSFVFVCVLMGMMNLVISTPIIKHSCGFNCQAPAKQMSNFKNGCKLQEHVWMHLMYLMYPWFQVPYRAGSLGVRSVVGAGASAPNHPQKQVA